jgi:hypothetical protein
MKWTQTLLIAFALIVGAAGLAVAQEGYGNDGYRNNRGVYGPYNQGPYNQGPYDQNPYYNTGIQQAQQNGYQWGLRDGQVDRQAGRSYRATSNETYRHATVGYVSAYGDKNHYKWVFRQAYEQGYQRGYGAGGYGGPYGQYGRVPWGR